MRDENFDVFIDEFGEATLHQEVPQSSIEKWTGALPDQLLSYWKQEGWSAYGDGRFWTVNPDDYEPVLNDWLKDTPLLKVDKFHVIARTAFGQLFVWGERSGSSVQIIPAAHAIVCLKSDVTRTLKNADRSLQIFFAALMLGDADMKDDSGKPMFERALKKLGPLNAEQMYGFEPALVAGGASTVKNLKKVDLQAHLTILRQLGGTPTIPFGDLDIPEA